MRISLVILLFNFFVSGVCYGQTSEKIPIPVLKENKVIDSLMDVILNPNTQPNVWNNSKLFQDSCMDIDLTKESDGNIFVRIYVDSKKQINYYANLSYKTKAGYFKYKGLKIFVFNYELLRDFFTPSSSPADLKFIFKLKDISGEPPDGLISKGSRVWDFEYKDKRFSEWYVNVAY